MLARAASGRCLRGAPGGRAFFLIGALLRIFAGSAAAEEPPPREEAGLLPVPIKIVHTDRFTMTLPKNPDEGITGLLLGNVEIATLDDEFTLHADAIGLFIAPEKDAKGDYEYRLVATGNVLLFHGALQFRAATFCFESADRRAVLTDLSLRTLLDVANRAQSVFGGDHSAKSLGNARRLAWLKEVQVPAIDERAPGELLVAASRLTIEDFAHAEAQGVVVTNCQFAAPHWALTCAECVIDIDREPEKEAGNGGRTVAIDLGLSNGYLEIGRTPILPQPPLRVDSRWFRSIPLRRVAYSNSSKFGNRVDTLWDGSLLLPHALGRTVDLALEADYLSRRGIGYGAQARYGEKIRTWPDAPDGRLYSWGEAVYFAIQDRGTDRNDLIPEHRDRSRVRWHHRSLLPWGAFLDAEYATERDRNFLNEYFKTEVRGEKVPESLLYLRQPLGEDAAVTLLGKERASPFRTEVERVPEAAAFLIERPLGASGFALDGTARASVLRFRPDRALNQSSESMLRGDVRAALAYPFGSSTWLRARPFFESRFTSWEEDVARDNTIERLALATGVRSDWNFARTFALASDTLGIDGVRHVVHPQVSYELLFHDNVRPAEVFPFDETEAIDLEERVTFALENYLFARVSPRPPLAGERPAPRTARALADTRVGISYFPEKARDNSGDLWGPLFGEALLYPTDRLHFFTDAELDVERGAGFIAWNGGLSLAPREDSSLQIASRYREHNWKNISFGARSRLSSKYELLALCEYDLRRRIAVNQQYGLVRSFHCWALALKLEFDEGEDDNVAIKLEFGPLELMRAFSRDAP